MLLHWLCRLEKTPIDPDHLADSIRRRQHLAEAAAIAPYLAERVLPHLLQPLQEHRFTSGQLWHVLHGQTGPAGLQVTCSSR
jgi:hypothetical protein